MVLKTVTVFGGSGFLGRQIVRQLAAGGHFVRVAVRRPERASFFEEMGCGDRTTLLQADVGEESSVTPAVVGADAVVNCVGHYVEKGAATFDRIHAQGALHVARQARLAGVARLILISGLGADPDSASSYVRARGIGEALVREAFAEATILRPSVIFGPGDSFFNTLAALGRRAPVLPLFGGGRTRLQPVFIGDVVRACLRALEEPATAGKTYELGGPRAYSYRALIELTLDHIARKRLLVPVPFFVWEALAALFKVMDNPPITRDQVALMRLDNLVGSGQLSFKDLGMDPVSVEEILPTYITPRHGLSGS